MVRGVFAEQYDLTEVEIWPSGYKSDFILTFRVIICVLL